MLFDRFLDVPFIVCFEIPICVFLFLLTVNYDASSGGGFLSAMNGVWTVKYGDQQRNTVRC